MGEGSYVNQTYTRPKGTVQQAHTSGKLSGIHFAGFDWVIAGIVVGLTLFGLLMVYSAGPKLAQLIGSEPDHFLKRQLMWAVAGIVVVFGLSLFPYRIFQRLTVLLMGGTIALLIIVAVLADTTLGANRSILSGSIRPSELAKLVTIIYFSVWLNAKRDVLDDIFMGIVPLALIMGVTGALILIQPDLSAAITVGVMGIVLFFLAGGSLRQIAFSIAIASLAGWGIINVYDTGYQRVADYVAGLQNPLNASYHVQRSLEAIINGGLFGVGIGHSSTKFTGLPVAPTDSIFAVVAEEMGLFGVAILITAYTVLLWRGLSIARRAPDALGSLLAGGITVWIVVEAILNMMVMVNLLPQAGNALPFISYGGSSLLVTLAGVGILMNIARSSNVEKSTSGGSTFGSVVDLRWRDRRRGVSRNGRSSGTRS